MAEIRTWEVTPHGEGDQAPIGLTIKDAGNEWVYGLRSTDGGSFVNRKRNLRVIVSAAWQTDGKRWIHVSVSRVDQTLPTYPELMHVRDTFLGDVECYQIHPPLARHVNIHPGVLHLFACFDQPAGVLPNMEGEHPAIDGKSL